jgi:hypothetical protein
VSAPLITAKGAYPGIPAADYHGNPNLLPGPSLSASGGKVLVEKSAAHFWHGSAMNPKREESNAPHFSFGRAAHDLVLLGGDWRKNYHVLPEGFSRAKKVAMAEDIAAADYAISKGKTIIKHEDMALVEKIADRIGANEAARHALMRGVPEMTLAWQDELTGVWLRARPDFLPQSCIDGDDVRIVSDLKFMAGTHCSPRKFAKAMDDFGYHIAAAHYGEGIKQVFGKYPSGFVFVVVEKDEPHTVSLYYPEPEDIERGRNQMRQAINLFAACLKRNQWPGYADQPMQVGLPIYARMRIDESTETDLAKAIWGEPEGEAA